MCEDGQCDLIPPMPQLAPPVVATGDGDVLALTPALLTAAPEVTFVVGAADGLEEGVCDTCGTVAVGGGGAMVL